MVETRTTQRMANALFMLVALLSPVFSQNVSDTSKAGSADSVKAESIENSQAENEDSNVGDTDHPLWTDVYAEGVYSGHENGNLAGFSEFKIGRHVPVLFPVDFYAKMRVYRDRQDFFWNNRADAGIGARVSLLKKVSLTLFGEMVTGQYLHLNSGVTPMDRIQVKIDRNRTVNDSAQKEFQAMYQDVFKANILGDSSVNRQTIQNLDASGSAHLATLARINTQLDSLESSLDSLRQTMDSIALEPAGPVMEYRAGLVFWYGWGGTADNPFNGNRWFSFPFRFWGDIYSDCIFSSLRRHVQTRGGGQTFHDSATAFRNLIFYANPNIGLVVAEGVVGRLAAYAAAYISYDTHADWWNNVASIGPGLRYLPFPNLDFAIKTEYLLGHYYGRERKEDPNPYRHDFRDLSVTVNFWYGLGV